MTRLVHLLFKHSPEGRVVSPVKEDLVLVSRTYRNRKSNPSQCRIRQRSTRFPDLRRSEGVLARYHMMAVDLLQAQDKGRGRK